MPKRAAGLSARTVQTIKTPGMHADGGGLYLQVTASGAKTWIFRYSPDGKRRREMGLGSTSLYGLAEARQKAQDARRLVAEGIDPIEARKRQSEAQRVAKARSATFREVAAAHIEANKAAWRNSKHAAQWSATLDTYAHPVVGDLAISEIETRHVLEILQPIWTEKPETASRVRGRIEAILDAATVQGLREGENPARWKGHLNALLPPKNRVRRVTHHAAMAYADLPTFWPRLEVTDGLAAKVLMLAILTAARTQEVLGARWDEFDLDNALWTIPAERMKAGAEHRVPLSAPAVALLRKLETIRRGDLVFSGQRKERPLSNMAMLMALRRLQVDATAHGFRATFRRWAADCTSTPHEVCEAALAHTVTDQVVAAYQRGTFFERRRALMDQWGTYVTTPAGGKVVPLAVTRG
ncbi:MAG: integrase arm-type DNA-binding domain-containing protein [Rhodospirillaceae bacterium]|nr:integrase arm-type DNA-binding domain-containing protein [Rhodospirillaceae bacterium]